MTLVLSNAEVAEVVSMKDCVDSLEDAFLELAEGRGAFRRRSDICTPSEHESGGMYALKSMDGVVPKFGIGAIRIPPNGAGSITLDVSHMTAPMTATWNDPTSRATMPAGAALTGSQTFTIPGTNACGSRDWVLVLR